MNRRKRWVRTGAWAGFVLLFLVICFLSFQTGSATKALEKPFINQVAGVLEEQPGVPYEMVKLGIIAPDTRLFISGRREGRFSFLRWDSAGRQRWG